MRLSDYWTVLSKRWPILVLLIITTSLAAGVYSKLQTKIYRATSIVSVKPVRFDYGQQLAAAQLLGNYALQLRRPELVSRVDDQLRLDLDPQALRANINDTPTNENMVEQIDVDDSDPRRAAAVATALASAFVQEVTDQQQSLQSQERIEASLLYPADVPGA